MMNRLMMIAAFVLAIGHIVRAEDNLTVSDFSISAGETREVSILLTNDVAYVAFQFDLYLPEGITVTGYNADPTRVPKGTTLDMVQQSNGSYRFISAAMSRLPLTGKSGCIVSLTVKASQDLEDGTLTGYFTNVKLSKSDATGPTHAEMPFTITVTVSGPSIVTAKNVTREYGDANPELEYTVAGAALKGTPVVSCEANSSSKPGQYPITISKGSVTNSEVTFVDGILTVTKAPLTISAKSYSIKQGEPLPKFEITYSGFKNNETASVLKAKPSVTCAATAASEPGTYDIIVSSAAADNYDITYAKGTLRIRSLVAQLGDINDDGEVDVTDVVELIDMVLAGSTDPSGDINGDGEVDVTDVVELIDIVLAGG